MGEHQIICVLNPRNETGTDCNYVLWIEETVILIKRPAAERYNYSLRYLFNS